MRKQEEQAAANISKCKRLQRELEDAEDRAEHITKNFLRANSVARTNENYDSDYGDSDQFTPSNLIARSSHHASNHNHNKALNVDDQEMLIKPYGMKSPTMNSWRARYKTLDIDDDDIVIQHRPSKYSYTNAPSCKFYQFISFKNKYFICCVNIFSRKNRKEFV